MRKAIIVTVMALLAMGSAHAQEQSFKKEGTVITAVKTSTNTQNDVQTSYTFRDSKGLEYPIMLHKVSRGENEGKWQAYVVKTSAKTGNTYKAMVPNAKDTFILGEQLAKELGL